MEPEIVCICGSTQFADEHAIARWVLEKDGRHIGLMINYLPQWYTEEKGWEGNDHQGESAGCKQTLDELHKRKIDLADWVLVVNKFGYVGESTSGEIDYARAHGKPIKWMYPDQIPEEFQD